MEDLRKPIKIPITIFLLRYGRRNNIEITGIPGTVQDNELENKVIEIFGAIGVEANSADFEDCHRVGKPKNNS